MLETKDTDQATRLIQFAELDLAKYLNRPEDFMVIEWLEGVQQQLSDALHLLGADPIPLLEEDEDE
jgi:hypothetical protein